MTLRSLAVNTPSRRANWRALGLTLEDMTYLTAEPSPGNGVVFRPDPYGFDTLAMPQMEFGGRS